MVDCEGTQEVVNLQAALRANCLLLPRRAAEGCWAKTLSAKTLAHFNAPLSQVAGAFVFLEEAGKGQRFLVADGAGIATATLEPTLPAQVRAAALAGGSWALAAGRAGRPRRRGSP
jgi:hypothetical protein